MDWRSRDVENGCGRVLGEVKGTDLSGVTAIAKVVPVARKLEITMGHRFKIGDASLKSELMLIVKEISNLSYVHGDVEPFVISNEVVGRGDASEKRVVDTTRRRLWHGMFEVDSKAKEGCPKEWNMGKKRMKGRF